MVIKAVSTLATVALASSAFAQATINWDTNRAQSSGNKQQGGFSETICQKDVNTFFIDAGNTLSVILSDLAVNLPAGDNALTGRANCRIVVPAEVARGQYLADLEQTVTFGVVKGRGASARVAANSSFFGYTLPTLSAGYDWQQVINDPLRTISRRDRFVVNTPVWRGWFNTWCTGRAPKGIYTSNLAVGVEKNNRTVDALTNIDGLDVKFEIRPGALAFCPTSN